MLAALIKSFGCKVSFSESYGFAGEVRDRGGVPLQLHSHTDFEQYAGLAEPVVFINSCVVTESAERECIKFIEKLLDKNPNTHILFTGCLARNKPLNQEHERVLERVEVFDSYRGAADRFEELAGELEQNEANHIESVRREFGGGVSTADYHSGELAGFREDRSRKFLKVQDGCRSMCSFCIIPQTRPFRSIPWPMVRSELESSLESGFTEIVLTGVNIGTYEEPDDGFGIAGLVERIVQLAHPQARVRISSIEPESVTDALLQVAEHPGFCPHFHLPLQSGSDEVLEAMNRRYRSQYYMDLCQEIRERFPAAAINADIMAGFPTETEEDLKETAEVIREVGYERVHLFPYSERPYTQASKLDALPGSEVKRRLRELRRVHQRVRAERLRDRVGDRAELLAEHGESGSTRGYTEHYLRVETETDSAREPEAGTRVPVELTGVADGVFSANLLEKTRRAAS